MDMRKPDNLDMVKLEHWILMKTKELPNTSISIVSQTYGPLCGFVPYEKKYKQVFELDDKWFDPYKK